MTQHAADLQTGRWSALELGARMRDTLGTSIVPAPWDSTDEIGVEWWTVRRPDGGAITGFDGIGVILIERCGAAWSVGWAVSCPELPGAEERRAWLKAAIAMVAGPDAIVVDGGRVVRERGKA